MTLSGAWTVSQIGALDGAIKKLTLDGAGPLIIDGSGVTLLDTAGAWIIDRTRDEFERERNVLLAGLSPGHQQLVERVDARFTACDIAPPAVNPYLAALDRTGKAVIDSANEAVALLALMGRLISATGAILIRPTQFRLTSFVVQLEKTGLNAIPIISLMSFLVGAVLAFLGADLLRDYGAQDLIVQLVGYSFLREFGVLLTAIMVAGRSGSAFTAEIGSMKQHEEIDAMRTLALDPIQILILPRVLALILALPLVTIAADFLGLIGGGAVAWANLGITPGAFIARLYSVITLNDFLVGMVKAPVYGMLIAMIGCYQGMMVDGSAESVGRRTTKAVVQAIFAVIMANAAFSVIQIQWGI
ncbi:MAG: ABC transporter permease [Alphaproteobacteria bacterium]